VLASPTAATLVVFALVFAVQLVLAGFANLTLALSAPTERPLTLVTSVYAHAGVAHLVANAVALVVVGPFVERVTTPLRYHVFFVVTGAIAGVAEIAAGSLLGSGAAVLGASGAVFGLLGYLLAGNRLSVLALGSLRLSGRLQLAVGAVLAAAVTLATAAPGVALVAHFTGFLLGLAAGRLRLLHVGA